MLLTDLFDKFLTDKGPLGSYASKYEEGYFMFPKLTGPIQSRMYFRGKKVLTWSLNNYLGLANHPEIRKIDKEAAAEWGLAYPMGARMMSGNSDQHELLEMQLADFMQQEEAMLLNYGYQGVLSIIDAIVDRQDIIVYDAQSHACIIDGIRLHTGKRFVFQHNNIESLIQQLKNATQLANKTGGGILVITEGVFGMSGTIGKLKEIVELKKKFQFRLFVDDAHGFGTIGKTGAGVGEEQKVQKEIDLYFATFAKSMASIGAFVAGKKSVINYLRYNTRSQIFAKSLPMPFVLGNLKRLELLRTQPILRKKLWTIVYSLQTKLKEEGFDIGHTQSPVTPVFFKSDNGVQKITKLIIDLRERFNIFCSGVVYPVVPKNVIMLRLIPTASHQIVDVEETITAFKTIKDNRYL